MPLIDCRVCERALVVRKLAPWGAGGTATGTLHNYLAALKTKRASRLATRPISGGTSIESLKIAAFPEGDPSFPSKQGFTSARAPLRDD